MDARRLLKDTMHIVMLIALVLLLLGILTWTGVVKCKAIPGWCDVYYGIMTYTTGGPRVLIVYGESGLGNPVCPPGGPDTCNGSSLQELLANPELTAIRADTMNVDRVDIGVLKNYNIVIVDRAKQIGTRQLRAFIDYATGPTGGYLVWTGDAGTVLGPDDQYLTVGERDGNTDKDANKDIIGPWARKDDGYMVSFDQLLELKYKGNFCEMKFSGQERCNESIPVYAGALATEPSKNHPLVRGIADGLPLWIFKGQDFAVVEKLSGGITTEVMTLEFPGTLYYNEEKDGKIGRKMEIGKSASFILTSGIGGRVAYYAMPLEYFANPKLEAAGKGRYFLPIENMYFGLIYG